MIIIQVGDDKIIPNEEYKEWYYFEKGISVEDLLFEIEALRPFAEKFIIYGWEYTTK